VVGVVVVGGGRGGVAREQAEVARDQAEAARELEAPEAGLPSTQNDMSCLRPPLRKPTSIRPLMP